MMRSYGWSTTDKQGNVIPGEQFKAIEIGTAIEGKLYRLDYLPKLQYYDYYLQAAQKMIDSFEITNTTGTTEISQLPLQYNITSDGYSEIFEYWTDGDRYSSVVKPSGEETCIDNNNNLVCDVTEPNAPPLM